MPLSGDSAILVPVDVSVAEPPDRGILELLRPVDVVVLGYYPVPDQTAPAHLKSDHEAEASARLDAAVDRFEDNDHEVEGVLVFTKDHQDTIDRVAEEYDCDAVLVPGDGGAVERILVPLRGDVNLERIVSLVADLVRASDAHVTLLHSVADDADPSQGEFMLRGAVDRLTEEGGDRARVDWELDESRDPRSAVVALASDHDLVVLGETEPSLRDRIIGTVLTPIIESIDSPAIVVRDTER
jgi:nucleotide-binding universal stress UspA family protein